MTIAEEIRSSLVANIDEGYRDFHAKLVPTIDPARILGVRLPAQRAVAKAFKKDARLPEFLAMTAHDYVEEINVHGFLVAEILDADACLAQINHFLPMIDNWANCDSLFAEAFQKASGARGSTGAGVDAGKIAALHRALRHQYAHGALPGC